MQPRVYRYRKSIQWGQYTFPAIIGFNAIGLAVCTYLLPSLDSRGLLFPLDGLLYVFPVLVGVFGWFIWSKHYELAGVAISIDGATLVYATRGGVERIPLKEITRLEYPSAKYGGGWLKIITVRQTIRLAVTIEDMGPFLLEFKEALDANEMSERYDRKEFFRFFTVATQADHSSARIAQISWGLVLATLLSGALWIGLVLVADLGLLAFLLTPIPASWYLLVYMVAEMLLARSFYNGTDEETFYCPGQDVAVEKRIYRKATTIGVSIYLGVLVVCMLFSIWG